MFGLSWLSSSEAKTEGPSIFSSGFVHRTYVVGTSLDSEGAKKAKQMVADSLNKNPNDVVRVDYVLLKHNGMMPCISVDVLISPTDLLSMISKEALSQ